MKKKLISNYFYNIIYQFMSLIIPIITTPYLARTLKAKGVGIYNYTYSIVYWFILIGMLGLRLYGNKEIAKVRDNKKKMSKTFFEIFQLQVITNLVALIAYYLIFLINSSNYRTILLIQGIYLISSMFDVSWYFYGIEELKKVTTRDFCVKMFNLLSILLFIKSSKDLMLYILLTVLFNLFGQVIMWLSLIGKIDYMKVNLKDSFKHLKPTFLLFIPQIAGSIYCMFDRTMIGMLSGNVAEVAFYSKAYQFVSMFLFLITSIGTVMMPRLVNLNANNGKKKSLKYTSKTFDMVLLLSIPMAFGLAGIANYFVPWFLTDEFLKVGNLIMILSPIIIFISMTNVLGLQLLIPMEKTREYTISVTVSAIVNLCLNLILIKCFNSFGAAIASVIAEALVLLIQYHYAKGLIPFKEKILRGSRYLLFSIIMFISIIFIGKIMGASLLTNVIQFLVGVLIYILLLIIFKDDVLKFIFNTFKSLIKIKVK